MADNSGVENTCPKINDVIKNIEVALEYLDKAEDYHMSDTALDYIGDAKAELEDLGNIMEEIRTANSDLRAWGSDRDDKVEELEKELSSCEQELNDCKYE